MPPDAERSLTQVSHGETGVLVGDAVGCDAGDHLLHIAPPPGTHICARCIRRANRGAA